MHFSLFELFQCELLAAGGDEVQDGAVRAADGGGARQEGGRDHPARWEVTGWSSSSSSLLLDDKLEIDLTIQIFILMPQTMISHRYHPFS